jgi:hypothetical protein
LEESDLGKTESAVKMLEKYGDKEKAVESRKKILEYAKQNNLTISGMHLPY